MCSGRGDESDSSAGSHHRPGNERAGARAEIDAAEAPVVVHDGERAVESRVPVGDGRPAADGAGPAEVNRSSLEVALAAPDGSVLAGACEEDATASSAATAFSCPTTLAVLVLSPLSVSASAADPQALITPATAMRAKAGTRRCFLIMRAPGGRVCVDMSR
jgi:hypothetical protein